MKFKGEAILRCRKPLCLETRHVHTGTEWVAIDDLEESAMVEAEGFGWVDGFCPTCSARRRQTRNLAPNPSYDPPTIQ